MANRSDIRRRWSGVIFLAIAVLMLILGTTALEDDLEGRALIYYWAGCLLFVGLAVLMALLDTRALRQRARQEHRQLFEEIMGNAEASPGKGRGEDKT